MYGQIQLRQQSFFICDLMGFIYLLVGGGGTLSVEVFGFELSSNFFDFSSSSFM